MSYLDKIFARKREEVEAAKTARPLNLVRQDAESSPPTRCFSQVLFEAEPAVALIAEVKSASPSQGTIRVQFDPVAIALAYERAGAHALSVLTDGPGFSGSIEHLQAVKAAVPMPILRKDFTCDVYQIYESRAIGADAILLIVAGLTQPELHDFFGLAMELDLEVLVETHSEAEVDRALELGATLIGVNNRDLYTFETDLAMSDRLIPLIAGQALAISESALTSHDDVLRVERAGARAVLIGTAFCQSDDVERKVREVMGWDIV